jgi:hypothetical protein
MSAMGGKPPLAQLCQGRPRFFRCGRTAIVGEELHGLLHGVIGEHKVAAHHETVCRVVHREPREPFVGERLQEPLNVFAGDLRLRPIGHDYVADTLRPRGLLASISFSRNLPRELLGCNATFQERDEKRVFHAHSDNPRANVRKAAEARSASGRNGSKADIRLMAALGGKLTFLRRRFSSSAERGRR